MSSPNPPRVLKQTYVVLRPGVAKAVKIAAAERGTTMQQIVAEALEKYLNVRRKRETEASSDNVNSVTSPASHP